jgi:hypothetical protein
MPKGTKKVKKLFLTPEIEEMVHVIILSDLRPVEKAVLISEWILREVVPGELFDMNLNEFLKKIRTFLNNEVPSDLREIALKEAKELFGTESDSESFVIVAALSYYSYVNDEFVYDRAPRDELLAKISELGLNLTRVKSLYKKFSRIAGTSSDLFNRVFRKTSTLP